MLLERFHFGVSDTKSHLRASRVVLEDMVSGNTSSSRCCPGMSWIGYRSLKGILVADDQDAKALPVRGGRFRVAELGGKSVARRDTILAATQQSESMSLACNNELAHVT